MTRAIFSALKSEIKLDFHRAPQPFTTSPLLVTDKDVALALTDLAKEDSSGAYQAILPNGQDFLSRTRVDTRPGSANQRVVLTYTGASIHSQRAQSSKSIFQAHRQRRVAIASLHDVQVVRQGQVLAHAGLAASHHRQVAVGATSRLAYHSTLAYRRVVARHACSSGTVAGFIATKAFGSNYAQPHSGTIQKRSHGPMRRRVEAWDGVLIRAALVAQRRGCPRRRPQPQRLHSHARPFRRHARYSSPRPSHRQHTYTAHVCLFGGMLLLVQPC